MSLEKLKQEVAGEAERQAAAIIRNAEREAGAILDEAHAKAKATVAGREKLGESQAAEAALELRASALLQARRLESEAKEEVAENVLGEIGREFGEAAKKPSYEKVFDRLAREAVRALGSKEFVIKTNGRDRKLGAKHGPVSETIQTAGGLIVAKADGSVQINNTFEALLEENKERVKQKAFEGLFGKEKADYAMPKPGGIPDAGAEKGMKGANAEKKKKQGKKRKRK